MRTTRRAAAALLVPALIWTNPLPAAQATSTASVSASRTASAPATTTVVAEATVVGRTKVRLKVPSQAFTKERIEIRGRTAVRSKKTRVVRLDVRKGGTWKRVASTRTSRSGAFTFSPKAPASATTRRYRFTVDARGSLPRVRATRSVKILKAPPAAQTPTPKRPDFTAAWQRRTLTLGQSPRFTSTGTVPGPTGRQRKVVLQRRHADGWKTVARATTSATGAFTLHAPADWLINLEHRVYVPATSKARKRFSQATRLVVQPSWTPRGSSSDWAPLLGQDRLGYRWDGCRGPITYRVNRSQAPAFVTQDEIAAVMKEVSEATGLQFTYAGTTPVHAFGLRGTSWPADAELVISWTHASQTSQEFASDHVVGLGGAEGYRARDSRGEINAIARGHALVRVGSPYLTPDDEAETWQVLKHEVAHAVGLGHAPSSSRQLMGPSLRQDGDRSFGAGDLAGLRRLGYTEGCISGPSWSGTTLGRAKDAPETTLAVLP